MIPTIKTVFGKSGAQLYRSVPTLMALFGIALSLAAAWLFFKVSEITSERQWRQSAQDEITHIERHIERSLGWLDATRGLYQASNSVTESEFNAFISALNIDNRVVAIEWAPFLKNSERQAFRTTINATKISATFQIFEIGLNGKTTRREDNEAYFPVTYIYPFEGNDAALGYDLASETTRYHAIKTAINNRSIAASSRMTLMEKPDGEYGFLVLQPVFRNPLTVPSNDNLTIEPMGIIVGVYAVERLISNVFLETVPTGFKFDIFDMSAPDGARRLYPKNAGETVAANRFLNEFREIKVADRNWRVYVSANAAPFNFERLFSPVSALLFGFAVTGFSVFQLVESRRKAADSIAVYRRNRELLEAQNEANAQRNLVEAREAELKSANNEIRSRIGQLEALSGKLSRYLSPQLYDQLFTGKQDAAIMSERKKLTVLFSDLVNFANFADQIAPEDLTLLVNEYMTEMSKVVDKFGGTIDKFLGDGILIFFGDHQSKGVKEDAVACTRMAIKMRSRLAELNLIWQSKGIVVPVVCRMGISTGYCAVGNFGSDERLDYTIMGSTVNLASRLEHVAEPNAIVVSPATHMQIRSNFECTNLGKRQIRGLKSEIDVWQVEDEFAVSSSLGQEQHTKLPHMELDLVVDQMTEEEILSASSAIEKAGAILKKARKKKK